MNNEYGDWFLRCPLCSGHCKNRTYSTEIYTVDQLKCYECNSCVYLRLEEFRRHMKEVHNRDIDY